MNLNRKLEIAKTAVDSITTHDDAIFEAIELQAKALHEHIDQRVAEARARRMAKAEVEVKPATSEE